MKLFDIMETSFEKYDETIRRYLQKAFNSIGVSYTHNQIFEMIFAGVKGIMENIMFYIEDALTEQNVFTAVRKQSVYSLAKLSGYEPYYGAAACGALIGKVQINNRLSSKTSRIYIKNKEKILNKSTGVFYSILLPTSYYIFDVSQPLINHEFKIVQGIFKRVTASGQGNNFEIVNVVTPELFDRQYVEVKVNGETWQEVGNIYDMTENGHEYVLQIGYENSFDIMFGNDVYGTKLTKGDTVTIDYLSHDGTLGNILSTDRPEFMFNNYGIDTLNNEVNINDYMILEMKNCISGGNNSDSIDFIRNMIGTNSRSLVLVSEDNFNLFFKRFSFIGYVNCWAESNEMIINAICLSNVKSKIKDIEDYFKMNISDMLLTYDQKNMVINTLENSKKSFAGLTLKFKDPVIRQFAFICYVKVDNIYNKDTASQSIRKILGEYFLNIKNNTLFIAKSELISLLVTNIECIQSIDLDIISEYGETAYYNNTYKKYELRNINNKYSYIEIDEIYESTVYPGLDSFGNISLNSKLEVPVLHGGFKYYPNKNTYDKTVEIRIPDIQVYFI